MSQSSDQAESEEVCTRIFIENFYESFFLPAEVIMTTDNLQINPSKSFTATGNWWYFAFIRMFIDQSWINLIFTIPIRNVFIIRALRYVIFY